MCRVAEHVYECVSSEPIFDLWFYRPGTPLQVCNSDSANGAAMPGGFSKLGKVQGKGRFKNHLANAPRNCQEANGNYEVFENATKSDMYVDVFGHGIETFVAEDDGLYVPCHELKRLGIELYEHHYYRSLRPGQLERLVGCSIMPESHTFQNPKHVLSNFDNLNHDLPQENSSYRIKYCLLYIM